jgi:hypothetical protein
MNVNVVKPRFRGLSTITLSLPVTLQMQRRYSRRIQDQKKQMVTVPELERESPLTDLGDDSDQHVSPPKKRRRKAKVVDPVVYDIPPVEPKTTTYRGVSCTNSWSRLAMLIHHTHMMFLGRLGYVSHYTCLCS